MTVLESFRISVFRVVAERLSFTQAAEVLRVSQPAVTSHVKALEQELGVRLFDRAGGVRLTAAGKQLLRYAYEVNRLADAAVGEIGRLSGEERGTLRLGASTTIAQYLLPRMLAGFMRQHPHIELSVVSANTSHIVSRVIAREIDLGLIEGPPAFTDLKLEPFVDDEIVPIVEARHGFVSGVIPAPSIAALREQPLLMREPGSGTRRVVENALRKAGLSTRDLRIVIELDSTEAIKSGVEAGLGIGFVSRWALHEEPSRTIRIARIGGLTIKRPFQFVHAQGPAPQGTTGAFLSLARQFWSCFKCPS